MYVVAASVRRDADSLQSSAPELWRSVRRFNRPVQLAVAASDDVRRFAEGPATAALVALAPCNGGSPELYRSAEELALRAPDDVTPFRLNPTHTLHAVDNLALSAVAIALGNRSYGVGLGGVGGQAWEGLEIARERLELGLELEVLLFAGDQEDSRTGGAALGAALLLAGRPRAFAGSTRVFALRRLEWTPAEPATPRAHAALGLVALVTALKAAPDGAFRHVVPACDGDGDSLVTVVGDVSCAAS